MTKSAVRSREAGPVDAEQLAGAVLAWFDAHGRKDLPWQQNPTPYRVWVSEIMLQQTRVSVVIPYFDRFMVRFPNVSELAAAREDEVLYLWSGLGYYARARSLRRTAQVLASEHDGAFPTDFQKVLALPGIGPSTAGAILSLSMGQRHAILDGNVKRVLARRFAVPGWPGQASVRDRLWSLAETCTPRERVADYNQAMMDLGATLCTRGSPDCEHCPLESGCRALATGDPAAFPAPKPRKSLPTRKTDMLVLLNPAGEVLLERRPPNGIWGGLWSLPEQETGRTTADWCTERLGTAVGRRVEMLPRRRHTFSHFHLDIRPVRIDVKSVPEIIADDDRFAWCDPRRPGALGLAAPIARILKEISEHSIHDEGESK